MNIYVTLSPQAFIRLYTERGYIQNQLTKHDRVYDVAGRVFLSVISRAPCYAPR